MRESCYRNRRPLAMEKFDSRLCLAMGDLDPGFAASNELETSYPIPSQWDAIGGMWESSTGFTQILRVQTGAGSAVALADIDPNGELVDLSYFADPVYDSQSVGFDDAVRLSNGNALVLLESTGIGSSLLSMKPDGSLDNSFGDQGILRLSSPFEVYQPFTIFADPLGGFFTLNTGSRRSITKYDAQGEIDRDFGFEGEIFPTALRTPRFGQDGSLTFYSTIWMPEDEHFRLQQTRYLADGSLDLTYGVDGVLEGVEPLQNSLLIPRANGGFIERTISGVNVTFRALDETGALDTSFGQMGATSVDLSLFPRSSVFDGTTTSDGGLVFGLVERVFATRTKIILVKLNANGEIDLNFGNQGLAVETIDRGLQVRRLLPTDNGEILTYGEAFDSPTDPFVLKFSESGRVDRSFGTDGLLVRDHAPASSGLEDLKLSRLTDGRWLAHGGLYEQGVPYWRTTQEFSSTGDSLGHHNLPVDTNIDRFAPAADGGWFSVSANRNDENPSTPERLVVAKYRATGLLDANFGVGGQLLLDTAYLDQVDVSVANNSLLLFASTNRYVDQDLIDQYGQTFVAKINASGLDASFGEQGILRLSNENFRAGYATPQDRVLLHYGTYPSTIVGLDSGGSLDPSFGVAGEVNLNQFGDSHKGFVDEVGRLLMLFENNGTIELLRVDSAGIIDMRVMVPLNYVADSPVQITARNGIIAVAGSHHVSGTETQLRLITYDYDGELLNELGANGFRDYSLASGLETALDLEFGLDDSLVLSVALEEGVNRFGKIIRLLGSEALIRHNWSNFSDVNNDGVTSALDALLVINHLNGAPLETGLFADSSNDDEVSSIDALLIINHLNGLGSGEGESEETQSLEYGFFEMSDRKKRILSPS